MSKFRTKITIEVDTFEKLTAEQVEELRFAAGAATCATVNQRCWDKLRRGMAILAWAAVGETPAERTEHPVYRGV